jgi:hypothetical protein
LDQLWRGDLPARLRERMPAGGTIVSSQWQFARVREGNRRCLTGDGRAEIELPIPVAPSGYRYFDVSLQENNGDPAHSGVSVLRGPTSS